MVFDDALKTMGRGFYQVLSWLKEQVNDDIDVDILMSPESDSDDKMPNDWTYADNNNNSFQNYLR